MRILCLILLLTTSPLAGVASENDIRVKLSPPGKTSWATFRNGDRQLGVAGSLGAPAHRRYMAKGPENRLKISARAPQRPRPFASLQQSLCAASRFTARLI